MSVIIKMQCFFEPLSQIHEFNHVTTTITQYISKKVSQRKKLGLSETKIFLTNGGCSERLTN